MLVIEQKWRNSTTIAGSQWFTQTQQSLFHYHLNWVRTLQSVWKRIHGGSVNYMGQRSGNPTNRFRTTRLLMSIRAGALDNSYSQRNDRWHPHPQHYHHKDRVAIFCNCYVEEEQKVVALGWSQNYYPLPTIQNVLSNLTKTRMLLSPGGQLHEATIG